MSGEGWANQKGDSKFEEAGVVYAIPCNDCHNIYVGQTGRPLKDRLTEHERAVRGGNKANALVRHQEKTGHCVDVTKIKVVFKEKNDRLALESYCIAANKSRKMNLAPPNNNVENWLQFFQTMFPDMMY